MNALGSVFDSEVPKSAKPQKDTMSQKKLKNALKVFLCHIFLLLASHGVWGGVGNLTWGLEGIRRE